MPTFIVTEVVIYRVEAETAAEADTIIGNATNPNDYLSGVTKREVREELDTPRMWRKTSD